MKRSFLKLLAVLAVSVCLAGCRYVSSYAALGLLRSNTSKTAEVSFASLRGRLVFRLKCTDPSEALICKGSVEEGSITVSIDNGDKEKELFSLENEEMEETRYEALAEGTVYIIVKTDGSCRKGNFSFRIE